MCICKGLTGESVPIPTLPVSSIVIAAVVFTVVPFPVCNCISVTELKSPVTPRPPPIAKIELVFESVNIPIILWSCSEEV